jgi:hypothetical protein
MTVISQKAVAAWKSELMIPPKDCGLVSASFAKIFRQRCLDLLGATWSRLHSLLILLGSVEVDIRHVPSRKNIEIWASYELTIFIGLAHGHG